MIINSPEPQTYIADDYDFTFANGLHVPLSIVRDLGDSVDFDTSPLAVKFHFVEKASSMNAEATIQSEEVTVLMNHVIMVSHRQRTVIPPTKEEKDLFKQTLHQMGRTV